MTERTITLTEAQGILQNLADQPLEETLVITSQSQPCLTLMSYRAHQELLANIESLQTVLEIMIGSSTEHPRLARPPKAALSGGKSTSWEEFKAEVGWE
ncbi:MAG TPA: hypothetical protein VGD98_20610 [Ktedonobacteraceae bacterium]